MSHLHYDSTGLKNKSLGRHDAFLSQRSGWKALRAFRVEDSCDETRPLRETNGRCCTKTFATQFYACGKTSGSFIIEMPVTKQNC